MGDRLIASAALPPSGGTILLPPPANPSVAGVRVELIGLFALRIGSAGAGEAFDALYRAGSDGEFRQPHGWLRWSPTAPILEREDRSAHRYLYRIPAESLGAGASPTLALDVSRLVDEFLASPSEIQAGLSGRIQIQVFQFPFAPTSLGGALAWAPLPAALAAGGVGWVVQRRRRYGRLSSDLAGRLQAIESECRHALAAAARARKTAPVQQSVEQGIRALGAGAEGLIRRIQELRNARARTDAPLLERELALLHARLRETPEGPVRQELERTFAQKEKTWSVTEELLRDEEGALGRLERIQAVLEATTLSLRRAGIRATPPDEGLCGALEAEVGALEEVARLLRGA